MKRQKVSNCLKLFDYNCMKPGLIQSKANGKLRVYCFQPLSSSGIEHDWDGPQCASIFDSLKEQLSRLPSGFFGQIIVKRQKSLSSDKHSLFERSGFKTGFYIIERDSGISSDLSLAQIFLDLGISLATPSIEDMEAIGIELLGVKNDSKTIPDILWEESHLKCKNTFTKVVSLTDAPALSWPGFLQDGTP